MNKSLRDEVAELRDANQGSWLGEYLRQMLARHPPADGVVVPVAVVEFLRGATPLDGLWFDEKVEQRGQFWWREHLPKTDQADAILSTGGGV